MALKTSPWDAADHLDSPGAVAAYIDAAMEDGDPALIAAALGDVARARGMTHLAKVTGLAREALYRSLSADGKPELATVLKVMKALGLRLSLLPLARPAAARRSASGRPIPRRSSGGSQKKRP
jgi:probable addiction module antidote protein